MTNRLKPLFDSGALVALVTIAFGALPGTPARAEDVSVSVSRPLAHPDKTAEPVPEQLPEQSSAPLPTPTAEEIETALVALPAAPATLPKVTPKAAFEKHVADGAARRQAKQVADPAVALRPNETLRASAKRLNMPLPLPNGHIVVHKAQRRLEVWSGSTLVKTYGVALGKTPTGHKAQQGDGRTPEGKFFICTRNAKTSSFHIFLGLSYPALPDATRGLKTKAISQREFMAIRNRLASRAVPLWRTRLGGWVGIHGGTGEAFALRQRADRGSADWTAGCIALTNKEIEELYAATKMGTPVSVRP